MSRKKRRLTEGDGWTLTSDADSSESAGGDERERLVHVRLEKRRGKPVTILAAEGIGRDELKAIATELKTACGSGGSVKGEEAVIQGDHRDAARALLRGRGIPFKG